MASAVSGAASAPDAGGSVGVPSPGVRVFRPRLTWLDSARLARSPSASECVLDCDIAVADRGGSAAGPGRSRNGRASVLNAPFSVLLAASVVLAAKSVVVRRSRGGDEGAASASALAAGAAAGARSFSAARSAARVFSATRRFTASERAAAGKSCSRSARPASTSAFSSST